MNAVELEAWIDEAKYLAGHWAAAKDKPSTVCKCGSLDGASQQAWSEYVAHFDKLRQ